jgi:cob(I)alamin adenosyltransferase
MIKPAKSNMSKGTIIVYTGNGKGKTTSAIGTGLRAYGQGCKVLMLQFIKGTWKYGELEAIKKLEPDFKIVPLGMGFIGVGGKGITDEERQNIRDSWERVKKEVMSDKYDMIIVDEINYVIGYGLLPVEEVLELLDTKPARLHLILTGRGAHEKIIEKADIATEMREIKHHYAEGVEAQKGIEF